MLGRLFCRLFYATLAVHKESNGFVLVAELLLLLFLKPTSTKPQAGKLG